MIALYRGLFSYWDLIQFMVRTRRRNTVFKTMLGTSWLIISPLAQMFIYYFLIVFIFRRGDVAGVHPFVMIMVGIIHYNFLQQSLMSSCQAILGNESLLMQVPLRPALFIGVTFLDGLRNLGIMLAALVACYAWLGPDLSWRLAWYPVLLGCLLLMTWTGSMVLATLSVFYRDLPQLMNIALRLLMYLSPVVYTLNFVPERLWGIFLLNPLGVMFALLQWCLLGGPLPPLPAIGLFAALLACSCVAAHAVYERMQPKITKAF